MKTTGESSIPKFLFLVFLGHPTLQSRAKFLTLISVLVWNVPNVVFSFNCFLQNLVFTKCNYNNNVQSKHKVTPAPAVNQAKATNRFL